MRIEISAAWSAGVRYYDTSPWYGLGLCERRFGNFLHTQNRSDYVLSSKVGKLLKASRRNRRTTPTSKPGRQLVNLVNLKKH